MRPAARLLVRALSVFEELGDRLGQAKALLSLGMVRQADRGLPVRRRGRAAGTDLSRELGRQRDHAQALGLLGDVRRDTGDYPPPSRPPSRP